MAHTCPDCGMICYCKGDIDDIDFGERWDCNCALTNKNCPGHAEYDDDWDLDYEDDNDDIITDQ